MENWEREVIRDLAKEKLEISHLPEMQERAALWKKHNELHGDRPMVHFEIDTVLDEGFLPACKCVSEDAIAIEKVLHHSMTNHKMVGDDRVVTDEFVCRYRSGITPFQMPIKKEDSDGIGFHIISQIENLNTLEQIKLSFMEFDTDESLKWKQFVEEQIDDILHVRMGMGSLYVSPTNDNVHRMGMENMFFAMYDDPDNFHAMMDSLTDDYVKYLKELEKRHMLVANNQNDPLCQDSFGFCGDLPDTAQKTEDCWGYMDSQETVGISADMFHEFFFPYYKKVADCYGLLSYGCCEPVHPIWETSVSKFSNLRKVSISPWCDEGYMGEQLRGSNIIYLRKPVRILWVLEKTWMKRLSVRIFKTHYALQKAAIWNLLSVMSITWRGIWKSRGVRWQL